jgi:hypothetical protein
MNFQISVGRDCRGKTMVALLAGQCTLSVTSMGDLHLTDR